MHKSLYNTDTNIVKHLLLLKNEKQCNIGWLLHMLKCNTVQHYQTIRKKG